MKILDMEQGSDLWHKIRGRLPTASNFGKIHTSTGKKSTQEAAYMHGLLANWMAGGMTSDQDGFQSEWMTRGLEIEDEAIAYYEWTVCEVERVGFCLRDDELAGCSPDALMPPLRRGLELKCPKASTHISYLLGGKVPTIYKPQIQGSMWVTGYESWDFMSYHPDLDPLLIHVERDEVYIAGLEVAVRLFKEKMDSLKLDLQVMGYRNAA